MKSLLTKLNSHPHRLTHRITLAGFYHAGPAFVVVKFRSGFLREQVISNAHGHFAALMQFLDDFVIVRVTLTATASVNRAGDTQAIEFTLKMARRIELIFK